MSSAQRMSEFLLGPSPTVASSLPGSISKAIHRQQLTSEKLISWVLLATVIVLSLFYFILPKDYSAAVKFSPIPWALLAYLIFGLLRLFLSYREYLPTWFVMLSGIFDITLLMILIWSLHLQYQQPASFYLKSPSLIFIFIFMALRTLRFDAKYVIIVGVTAALGWTALSAYAVLTEPSSAITNNFLIYMTSNTILINSELGKILCILIVTVILALAVTRARRLLVRAIEETIATRELSKFFAPELAVNIIHLAEQNIRPGYGEQRDIAILHCDIRGFTNMSKHISPNMVMELVTEYQSRMVKVIRGHNGSIDKFLGDGILASFNAIKEDKNYAADAMHAAMDLIATNEIWAQQRKEAGLEPIRIGVTVTTGVAIFGIVGDESRLEYTVIGDPVNVAVKLDKHTKEEHCQILAADDAFTIAVAQGFTPPLTVRKLPRRKVAGIEEVVDLVILQ